MSNRNFRQLLKTQWARGNFVCVGLDSDFEKIPKSFHRPGHECALDIGNTIVAFNRYIIEMTHDLVCAYKPNVAFYEAYGVEGLAALHQTMHDIRTIARDVPVILDAKRGDIGNTNDGYAKMAFDYFHADAITVHPYLGGEALRPFLDRKDKGIFVLCRTSNPGAGEFQDIKVEMGPILVDNDPMYRPIYQVIAMRVTRHWNKHGNCALVVGATYPDELREVRKLVGDMPILIPGIGAQGGDVEKTVMAGKDVRGAGMIINSSRGIIFAGDPRAETLKLRDLINQYR